MCLASGQALRCRDRSAQGQTPDPDSHQNDPVIDNSPDTERARIEEMARMEDRILHEERARVDNAAQAGNATQAESVLTEKERAQTEERARIDARELMLLVARYRRDVGGRTEEELVAEAPRNPIIRHPLELTRRLIDSNKNLQSELATSRESSERLTRSSAVR
jgi:hypothetical protein